MDSLIYRIKPRNKKQLVVSTLAGIGCYIGASHVFKKIYRKMNGYPDGPIGIPIFGSMLDFGKDTDKFMEDQIQYGEVSFFALGVHNGCVINSSNVMKQIFKNENAIDRIPTQFFMKISTMGNMPGNNEWKKRRKVLMKSFVTALESKIVSKAVNHSLNNIVFPKIDEIMKDNGVYYSRDDMVFLTLTTIFKEMTGDDIEKYPQLSKDIITSVDNFFKYFYHLFGPALIPPLLPIFRLMGTVKNLHDAEELMLSCTQKIIDIRQKVLQSKNNQEIISSVVDNIMNSHKNNIDGYGDILKCKSDIAILLFAGLDTTQTTTEFMLFMLGKKPDLQERIFNELKQNFDSNDISTVNKCHIFRAFIGECLRKSNIPTIGLPHYTKETIKITTHDNKKYFIPKNTMILANYLKISGNFETNRGKYENWTNPEIFNIDNFLDDNGKFKKNDSHVPFSVGKRDCIGMSFAYKLSFNFSTYMFQLGTQYKLNILIYIFRHIYSTISGFILHYQIKLTDINVKPLFDNSLTKKMDPQIPLIMIKR